MHSSKKLVNHSFYPILTSNIESIIPHNITSNHHQKLKTQCFQSYQLVSIAKKAPIPKRQIIQKSQKQTRKKQCLFKPMKPHMNEVFTKSKEQSSTHQNQTTNENLDQLYPNLAIKRTGSTAPIRKRLKSQNNKQNIINEEEPDHHEKSDKEPNKRQPQLESVSSIFHYSGKSKLAKLSNLMRFRNKPHMIFCSSKLPKDFFGESIQKDLKGEDDEKDETYKQKDRKLCSDQNIKKKLKVTSSLKLLNNIRQIEPVIQKLQFQPEKHQANTRQFLKGEPQFTFRKQKTHKKIQLPQQKTTITSSFEHNVKKDVEHFPSIMVTGSLESKQKFYRNFSRQVLKL